MTDVTLLAIAEQRWRDMHGGESHEGPWSGDDLWSCKLPIVASCWRCDATVAADNATIDKIGRISCVKCVSHAHAYETLAQAVADLYAIEEATTHANAEFMRAVEALRNARQAIVELTNVMREHHESDYNGYANRLTNLQGRISATMAITIDTRDTWAYIADELREV